MSMNQCSKFPRASLCSTLHRHCHNSRMSTRSVFELQTTQTRESSASGRIRCEARPGPCARTHSIGPQQLTGHSSGRAWRHIENRRCRHHVAHAKKKGKGGKQKKGPGSLMDIPEEKKEEVPSVEPYEETHVIMDNLLLIESYSRVMGMPLLEGDLELTDIAKTLWEAPFVILMHEYPEDGSEPIFSYANKIALELFEAEWQDLIGKPSSISANDKAQADRNQQLEHAREGGKKENISGWRQSVKGKPIQILGALLFNVSSPSGDVIGQSAVIRQWADEDGTLHGPDAPANSKVPTNDDISAAEQAVEDQGTEVRVLKEEQGLTNNDEPVQRAVEELLKRKSHLQQLKDRKAMADSAESAS